MRTVAVILALMLAAGCDNPFGPEMPPNAVEMEPEPFFDDWFEIVEEDAGVQGDFESIRWFKVIGGPWKHTDGTTARGASYRNRIYLADTYWTSGAVIRHEVLHYLIGDPNHTHPLFSTDQYRAYWKQR